MNSPLVRVMLVDDHDMVRRGLKGLISSKSRFTVVGEASDGQEALAVADEVKPDIVVLDFSLPKLNGLQVAERLKEAHPRTEIVMFTLFEQDRMVAEAVKIGVLGLVLKSEDEAYLLDALEAVALRRPYFTPSLAKLRGEDSLTTAQPGRGGLSAREGEIVRLIASGLVHKKIAYQLGISVKTVETHRTNALNKLGLSTTAELVRYAMRNDLITE